jgi:autotransporter-associated beta strand protein
MQRITPGADARSAQRRRRYVLVTSAAVSAALAALSPFAVAGLTHEYSFSGNANDSVGGANGTITGTGGFNGDNTALIFNGTDTFVTLPNSILPNAVGASTTIEVFGSYDTDGGGWERIFDIGGGTGNNFFFTPKSGPGDTRLRIKTPPTNGESGPLLPGNLATGEVLTLTAVLDGAAKTLSLYRNGGLLSTDPITSSLDQLLQTQDYIGKSQFADPMLKGTIDEFRIYDNAAAQYQIVINHYLGANTMTLSGTNSLSAAATVDWTDGTAWSGGHAPTATELANIATGATVNVSSDVGTVPMVKITKGTLNVSGGAITGGIDLAPGNVGPVTLNISNGGVVNTPRIFLDSGATTPGTGAKTINVDNATLHTTGTFSLANANVAINIATGGGIFDTEFGTLSMGTVGVTAPTTILTKQGAGTLFLSNGFAGALNVRIGTLAVSGNLTSTATHQLGDGNVTASLQFNGPSVVTAPLNVGNDSFSGNYSIVGNADAGVTFNSPITINRSVTIAQVATTGANALNIGAIDGGSGGGLARDLTFNNVGLVNVTGAITDDGGGPIDVVKNNTGKVVFSGANTYHNGTTINAGILQFNSAATVPGGVGGGAVVLINAAGIASNGPAFTSGLQAGLLDRVLNSSTGTIALGANTADSLDFSNLPALFLGATTNITYSGSLTPGNATYQLGGGGGTLNIAGNNALTGANALVVGGGSAGKVVLSGNSNDYTGGTTLKSNVLAIDKPAQIGTGPLTFSGGTLDVIGAAPFAYSNAATITAASTIQVDNTAGATFSGAITSSATNVAGTLFKTGPGNLIITGTVNTGTGSFHPKAGTVTIDTGGSITTGNFVSIGLAGGDVGTVVAKGTGRFIVNGDFNVSDIANTVGYLFIQDTATVSGRTIYIGKSVNALGTVVQTGGTFNGVGGGGDWRIGGNGSATDVNAVGTYNLSAGAFSTANNFQVGAFGQGGMTITGTGTATTTGGFPVVGRFVGGYGVLTVNGGTFNQSTTGQFPIIGEQGTGTLNIGGPAGAGGTFIANGAQLRLGHNGGTGVVNLALNGTIRAKAVNVGTGSGTFNLHGGTLQATAASTAFVANTNSYVWPEGGIIDNNGFDLTIAAPLVAPTGSGITSIALTSGGTGYVGSPIVKLTGGGGTGASAIPVISAGQVTGITITNPGVGYTSAPTVQILGGGGTNAAAGAISLAPNASGGITKNGLGTLLLSAANTYTGNTTVNAGTLRVTGSLAGGVVVNNSGLFDAAVKQTITSLAVNSGGTAIVSVGPLKVGNNSAPLPLNIATGGKLEIGSSGLIVDYQSTGTASDNAALASLRTPLKAGYGPNGDWKGTSGITSATAAANSLGAVGYALASDVLPFTNGTTDTFLGTTVDKSSVLARYTLSGDANLDGSVDFLDLAKLAQSYNVTDGSRQWSTGDFNYDGNTDFLDLAKLAQNYNTALPSAPIPGASAEFNTDLARAFAAVPEPSTSALALIAACGLATRRRRRRTT